MFLKNKLSVFFISCLCLLMSSCVSNKKHLAALDQLQTKYNASKDSLQMLLDTSTNTIYQLELKLAERIGENNILLILRNELQDEIERLEGNIENLSTTSSSKEQSLSQELTQRDKKIEALKGFLKEVENAINDQQNAITNITADLNPLTEKSPENIEISSGFDYSVVDVRESYLFRKNSTTRIQDDGYLILEQLAQVFQKYPNIKIQVVGHTDTSPPQNKKRYGDNWNYSALQAATVVRTLVEEYDVSANQLKLAAKAEFAPKASNASTEGKQQNRRIEFFISMEAEDLVKSIRKILENVPD